MRKQEFLDKLRKGLKGLSPEEVEEQLNFYGEMIDDRMEEGLSEEEAVAGIGDIGDILSQHTKDEPPAKEKRTRKGWEILLLVLGSPIWLALVIAAAAVILSLYAALWSVVISLWAVFVSLAASCVAGIAVGVVNLVGGEVVSALAFTGIGLFCAGFGIFTFFGCKWVTLGSWRVSRRSALWLWGRIFRKEEEL